MEKFLNVLSSRLNSLIETVGMALLAMMLCIVLIQVFGRYIVSSPLAWTEEIGRYAMVWTGLLGSTCSFYHRSDPKLMDQMQFKNPLANNLICSGRYLAVFFLLIPILIFGFGFIERHSYRFTDTTNLNSAWIVVVVPIFALITSIHATAQYFRDAGSRKHKEDYRPF